MIKHLKKYSMRILRYFCNDLNFRGLFTHHQSELSGVFTNFSLSFSSLNYSETSCKYPYKFFCLI